MTRPGRMVIVALLFLLLAAVSVVGMLARGGLARRAPPAESMTDLVPAPGELLPPLWHVPAFSYVAEDGRRVTDRSLLGHVWIADFIFTSCRSACPILSAKLVLLMRSLDEPTLRFVSFSVDPEHDSPAVLHTYRQRWAADPRWSLLATDATLGDLARGMRVAVERQEGGDDPILHSSVYLLVDATGAVRGVYDVDDREALRRLVVHAARLVGRPGSTAARRSERDGARLFATLGCAGCHADGRIAPELAGLAGTLVALADGHEVRADAAYLREAIVAPGARLVAGYVPLMPSYRAQLADDEVEALVAFLTALPAPAGGRAPPEAESALAVDPVCGMQVRIAPGVPTAERGGRRYYFCAEGCRAHFVADAAHAATGATPGPRGR